MVAFLSQEWLDLQRSLATAVPDRPGATARVQVVVTGGPDGEVSYVQTFEDGRLISCRLGRDDTAEVTLTQVWRDAVAIAAGELALEVAFMQGRVKVTGNMGALLAVQPVIQSPAYRAVLAELGARTELP